MAELGDAPPPRWPRLVAAVAFVVAITLLLALPLLGFHGAEKARAWLAAAARGPLGLPEAIAAFAILAFMGAPQVALIAAAALVFGPVRGALYSWIATLISAVIGYGLGRLSPSASQGGKLSAFVQRVRRNGFRASLLVRLAPLAPFLVINMAAGAARVRLLDFALGTAIGIVPKIILVAFAGGEAARALKPGGWVSLGLAVAALLALAALAWLARHRLAQRRGGS